LCSTVDGVNEPPVAHSVRISVFIDEFQLDTAFGRLTDDLVVGVHDCRCLHLIHSSLQANVLIRYEIADSVPLFKSDTHDMYISS
jgi:hypothetical protein